MSDGIEKTVTLDERDVRRLMKIDEARKEVQSTWDSALKIFIPDYIGEAYNKVDIVDINFQTREVKLRIY